MRIKGRHCENKKLNINLRIAINKGCLWLSGTLNLVVATFVVNQITSIKYMPYSKTVHNSTLMNFNFYDGFKTSDNYKSLSLLSMITVTNVNLGWPKISAVANSLISVGLNSHEFYLL